MDSNAIDIRVTAKDLASGILGGVNGQLVTLESMARKVSNAFKIAGTTIIGFGTASLFAASNFEQQAIAFKTMLGSADQAITLLRDLENFAKSTPFELTGLQENAKQLLAYNFAASEIIPTLTTVGNIAAGVGQDKIPILIRALGQIRAKGELKGQELLQLTETGLPIAETLARRVGVSVKQLNEDVSGLHIPFATVLESIKEIEQTRFADLMSEQSSSLKGIWSNIVDTLTTMGTRLGINSGLLDTAKYYAQGLLNVLNRFAEGDGMARLTANVRIFTIIIRQATDFVVGFVSVNQSLFMTLLKVGLIIGTGILIWSSMMAIVKAVSGVVAMFAGVASGTIVVVIALTVALYGFISAMSKSIGKQIDIKKVTADINNAFKKTADLTKSAGTATQQASSQMSESANKMHEAITKENKAYEEQFAEIVRNTETKLASNLKQLESEKKLYDESQKNKRQQHEDEVKQIKDLNQTRLDDLAHSLGRSIIIGSSTYDKDLANYKRVVEQAKLENQKRLENAEVTFIEETQTQEAEYNTRTENLKKQIADDKSMLESHSQEIRSLNIKEKADELTTLKNSHRDKLAEIQKQYTDQVSAAQVGGAGISSAMQIAADESEQAWADAFSGIPMELKLQMPSIQEVFNSIFGGIIEKLGTGVYNMMLSFVKRIYSISSSLGLSGISDKAAKWLKSQGINVGNPSRSDGVGGGGAGVWSKGSESIPNDHYGLVHKGEKIITASENPDNPDNVGKSGGKSSGTTIINNFYNSVMDANVLSSRLSFQIRNS